MPETSLGAGKGGAPAWIWTQSSALTVGLECSDPFRAHGMTHSWPSNTPETSGAAEADSFSSRMLRALRLGGAGAAWAARGAALAGSPSAMGDPRRATAGRSS